MNTPSVHEIEITINAQSFIDVSAAGVQLACRELEGAAHLRVQINNGDPVRFGVGDSFIMPHRSLRFHNDESNEVKMIAISASEPGLYQDNRLRGAVDVFGNVTARGNPLSTFGGSVSPVGLSKSGLRQLPTAEGLANVELIPANLNANGVIVRSMFIQIFEVGSGVYGARACAELGPNSRDFLTAWGIGHHAITYEKYIEPGRALLFGCSAGVRCDVALTYDAL